MNFDAHLALTCVNLFPFSYIPFAAMPNWTSSEFSGMTNNYYDHDLNRSKLSFLSDCFTLFLKFLKLFDVVLCKILPGLKPGVRSLSLSEKSSMMFSDHELSEWTFSKINYHHDSSFKDGLSHDSSEW